jgi:hypothetical protein
MIDQVGKIYGKSTVFSKITKRNKSTFYDVGWGVNIMRIEKLSSDYVNISSVLNVHSPLDSL